MCETLVSKQALLSEKLSFRNVCFQGRLPLHLATVSASPTTARASYKTVGCRWPGRFNFSEERRHVCQYVYTIIRPRVSQFLSNFLMLHACTCEMPNQTGSSLRFSGRKHCNFLKPASSRVPQFLKFHFHIYTLSDMDTKNSSPSISYTRNSYTMLGV